MMHPFMEVLRTSLAQPTARLEVDVVVGEVEPDASILARRNDHSAARHMRLDLSCAAIIGLIILVLSVSLIDVVSARLRKMLV